MTEYVIYTLPTAPNHPAIYGKVYPVLSRHDVANQIKILDGVVTHTLDDHGFEPFQYFKDDTPPHDRRCIVCSRYGAAMACTQCAQLIRAARNSYQSYENPKELVKEIIGQLCYFDNYLAVEGHHELVVGWNVINRIIGI